MTLLINMKETFLASLLMMKKHQIKLKQPWISEIGLNELGQHLLEIAMPPLLVPFDNLKISTVCTPQYLSLKSVRAYYKLSPDFPAWMFICPYPSFSGAETASRAIHISRTVVGLEGGCLCFAVLEGGFREMAC